MPIELTNVAIKGPKGDTGPSGAPLAAYKGDPLTYITPAVTFTGLTISDNGAGKVLLTGAGAHGLAAVDAVGAHVHVVTGTGWSSHTPYKIISLDADVTGNKIALEVDYTGQGVPSIVVGSALINYVMTSVQPLGPNSIIKLDSLVSFKNSVNPKSLSYRSLAIAMASVSNLTNIRSYRFNARIHMRGTNQSQIGLANDMVGGFGPSIGAPIVTGIDFSTDRVISLNLGAYQTEPITIESYLIEVYNL